ncbi:hypothetical protein G4B88_025580 [Cannabis sativa]|uniref:Uncharacterized protein n=1 Tax=Cannabis sativa TaxID=3483 RepID=A0A7J6F2E4_CANSA|nr:hypothetical protein G4B88_025580 [Cannabis sativa]
MAASDPSSPNSVLLFNLFSPFFVSLSCSSALERKKNIEELIFYLTTWNIGSPTPKFTLNGHLKGVNCIAYFNSSDKTYLLSGSDEFTAKIWDCEIRTCVQTLKGHLHNVSALCVLPELSIVITASEDGTSRLSLVLTKDFALSR